MNVPVYGTKLTLGLVENKLREANLLGETKRILIHADSEVQLGNTLKATFFKTNHSIPDSVGICIETPEGNVVHTGTLSLTILRSMTNMRICSVWLRSEAREYWLFCRIVQTQSARALRLPRKT